MAKILCTGGTGSFGSAFVKRFHDVHDITVISRDELKQYEMRQLYPDVKYVLCDVRDRRRVFEVVKDFEFIFHAAALKQVPSCEFFPMEAVKTNILGTNNILDAARGAKVVCLSTDKAVYPINAMGMSKALMEKVATSKGAMVTRYGNVMNSRGSVIPLWKKLAEEGKPLTITNPFMTRFLMSLDDSIELVWYAMRLGAPGETFIKQAPACTMATLAAAISDNVIEIGTRHGEKVHETLVSEEEMSRAVDEDEFYRIVPDTRDLNYDKFFTDGKPAWGKMPYSSDNTKRLNVKQVKELIWK